MLQEADEVKLELVKIGMDINKRLNKHFEQWGGGLQYKLILPHYASRAKRLGLSVTELSDALEEIGAIKVLNSPNGKRFIFSGDCQATPEEMNDWLQTQEMVREQNQEAKKQQRKEA